MIVEIFIPTPGESITEVEIADWFAATGDIVLKDAEIASIESSKATLPLITPVSGKIEIIAEKGVAIAVGSVACRVDTSFATEEIIQNTQVAETVLNTNVNKQTPDIKITPVAKNLADEEKIDIKNIASAGKRIFKSDVLNFIKGTEKLQNSRPEKRERMSLLRRKLSERLVAVKNETAMLTTFNEVDMSELMALRKKHQEAFQQKFGVKLGYMSFFSKAATLALQEFPNVNSMIDGDDLVSFKYVDLGIAVQTPKGLMVPVIRNSHDMQLPDLEKSIFNLAQKAREGKISIDELTGGTFTITNGGVFGSLLSTPILNPPQAGILGMHNIVDRPVAVNGQVVIRPMMYVAFSYDHRIIDGRDSVGFLIKVKEYIENPGLLMNNVNFT